MAIHHVRMAEGFPGERLTILSPAVVHRARALPICRDLCVTHLGRFDHVQGHYVERPRGRPEFVLIFCLSGEGAVTLGGADYHLGAGHGIVLPPLQGHRYSADTQAPWTIFWFHFTGRRAADYVSALRDRDESPQFWVQDVDQVAEAFEDCHRHVLGGYTDVDLLALSTSFARLLGLCCSLRRPANLRRRDTEERLLRSLRFMRRNLGAQVTLEDLARESSLSVPHFSAVFRDQMKCSPIEFHLRLKMQRACELLMSSSLTIGEIGAQLGYEDPMYFSRLFRKKIGIPARDYRRRGELRAVWNT